MIKATELRVGNIVKPVDHDFQLNVDEIKRNGIRDGSVLYTYETIEPVILTPEILESRGFKNRDVHDWYFDKIFFIEDNGEGELGEEWSVHVWSDWYKDYAMLPNCIYYLHQLQNLCFALTGKELEIKTVTTEK